MCIGFLDHLELDFTARVVRPSVVVEPNYFVAENSYFFEFILNLFNQFNYNQYLPIQNLI